jgi:hypothetical protein
MPLEISKAESVEISESVDVTKGNRDISILESVITIICAVWISITGAFLNVSASETISIGESVSVIIASPEVPSISKAESIAITEAVSIQITPTYKEINKAESIVLSEAKALQVVPAYREAISSEPITVSEAKNFQIIPAYREISKAESVAIAESVNLEKAGGAREVRLSILFGKKYSDFKYGDGTKYGFSGSPGESIALSEAKIIQIAPTFRSLNIVDSINLSEAVSATVSSPEILSISKIESVSVGEAIAVQVSVPITPSISKAESIAISESVLPQITPAYREISKTESIIITEDKNLQIVPAFKEIGVADAISVAESKSLQIVPAYKEAISSEPIAVSEAANLQIIPAFRSLNVIESVVIAESKILQIFPAYRDIIKIETIAISENIGFQIVPAYRDISVLDSIVITEAKNLQIADAFRTVNVTDLIILSEFLNIERIKREIGVSDSIGLNEINAVIIVTPGDLHVSDLISISESKIIQIVPFYRSINIIDSILVLDFSNIRRFIRVSKSDLPPGMKISMPITYPKHLSKTMTADGSYRWGFYKRLKKWELSWAKLTENGLNSLIDLYAKNQILIWQNTDESFDWYPIMIEDFFFDVIDPISLIKLYKAELILKEVV